MAFYLEQTQTKLSPGKFLWSQGVSDNAILVCTNSNQSWRARIVAEHLNGGLADHGHKADCSLYECKRQLSFFV